MPVSRTYMVAVATVSTRLTFFRKVDQARNAKHAARIACRQVRRMRGERCTVEYIAAR